MPVDNNNSQKQRHCLNCKAVLTGEYCAQCGQKHIEGAITLGYLIKTFFDAISNTDSRIFKTFKELIMQPGRVAKNYVAGRRKQYIDPIRLCLLIIGIYLAFLAVNGWLAPVLDNTMLQQRANQAEYRFFSLEFIKAWYELYSHNRLLIYLGSMPIAAVPIWLILYKSQYNYVATLTMLLYVGALYSFYGILVIAVYSLVGLEFFSQSRKLIELALGLIIYYQAILKFYCYHWLISMLITILMLFLLLLSAYIVTFTVTGLIVSLS